MNGAKRSAKVMDCKTAIGEGSTSQLGVDREEARMSTIFGFFMCRVARLNYLITFRFVYLAHYKFV